MGKLIKCDRCGAEQDLVPAESEAGRPLGWMGKGGSDVCPDCFLEEAAGGECWPWDGHLSTMGYGIVWVRGEGDKAAHRRVYELYIGPIPDGFVVCHGCDNPPCCNPFHLGAATMADNIQDSVRRGRHAWAKRTHCPAGHSYTEENTYRYKGTRRCRECGRVRDRRRYAMKGATV